MTLTTVPLYYGSKRLQWHTIQEYLPQTPGTHRCKDASFSELRWASLIVILGAPGFFLRVRKGGTTHWHKMSQLCTGSVSPERASMFSRHGHQYPPTLIVFMKFWRCRISFWKCIRHFWQLPRLDAFPSRASIMISQSLSTYTSNSSNKILYFVAQVLADFPNIWATVNIWIDPFWGSLSTNKVKRIN